MTDEHTDARTDALHSAALRQDAVRRAAEVEMWIRVCDLLQRLSQRRDVVKLQAKIEGTNIV